MIRRDIYIGLVHQDIIDHLRKLGNKEIRPMDSDWGLCYELADRFGIASYHTRPYFKKWPKYSGDDSYPIPSTWNVYKTAEGIYKSDMNKWLGKSKYSKLRLELCLFLADELEKELGLKEREKQNEN